MRVKILALAQTTPVEHIIRHVTMLLAQRVAEVEITAPKEIAPQGETQLLLTKSAKVTGFSADQATPSHPEEIPRAVEVEVASK